MARTYKQSFKHFERLVLNLNIQWQMFDDLYNDAANIGLYNTTAGNFFGYLRELLIDCLFVSVGRFFDPAVDGRKNENLSIEHMLTYPEVAEIKAELEADKNKLYEKYKKGAGVWRRTVIAHNDLPTVLREVNPPEVPFTELGALVRGISGIATKMHGHTDSVHNDYTVHIQDWVPEFQRYLRLGKEAKSRSLREKYL